MWEPLLAVMLIAFFLAVGITIGYNSARHFFKMQIETAEEKIRLAEHAWERIEEHDREIEEQIRNRLLYEQRAQRLKKIHELDFVHLSIPKGVPKDYNG